MINDVFFKSKKAFLHVALFVEGRGVPSIHFICNSKCRSHSLLRVCERARASVFRIAKNPTCQALFSLSLTFGVEFFLLQIKHIYFFAFSHIVVVFFLAFLEFINKKREKNSRKKEQKIKTQKLELVSESVRERERARARFLLFLLV